MALGYVIYEKSIKEQFFGADLVSEYMNSANIIKKVLKDFYNSQNNKTIRQIESRAASIVL